jgi:kinesin family protein 4/21/27
MARYNLEQEHLESLKKLEENLQKKHEEQLKALNDLVEQHRAQIKKLSEDHIAEKQEIEQSWQKKLAEELTVLKNEQREEMLLKEKLLDKAETEIRRAVLEIETKDKNIHEMTEFIEKTSSEYEERLAKIRKEFEDRLQDMKTNTGSSHEEQLRGVQEMIAKQHAEELERLKAEHDTVGRKNTKFNLFKLVNPFK